MSFDRSLNGVDVLRGRAHENPLPGEHSHDVQIAGGQDGLELKIGYIYKYIGIYPLIANARDNALQKVWQWRFGDGCKKPNMLGADCDAGVPTVWSPYLK